MKAAASRLAMLAVASVTLAGCASIENMLSGDKIDYRSGAAKTRGLEVPPDLTQLARDSRYQPPASGVVSAAGIAQQTPAAAAATPGTQTVAPAVVGNVKVERQGSQRWLSVPQPPEQVFPLVKAFWQERGFTIAMENAEAGVLETDWAENRAKIPMDFIRGLIGRVLDNVYDSGERDRFRTRIERTPDGGSEVYISHRGMIEAYTDTQKESTVWRPRPSDPQLEAEFLTRLMVKLGTREDAARAAVASAPDAPARARTLPDLPAATLVVDEPFDRAWRRVGLALDRTGFTVEDRDRAGGLYFVRYADPARPGERDKGFFARLFGSRSDDGPQAVRYRISVKGEGAERTTVSVLNASGAPEAGETGRRIVALLVDQLR